MASLTNYANNPRNNNPRNNRRISLLLLPILISILSTILLSTKMMPTLNNTNINIDNNYSSFDNVFGDSIKRQTREIELDYLTGNGAPPPLLSTFSNVATTDLRKVEAAQSTNDNINIISASKNNNIVNSKGSRTARYQATKDAQQQQLQLDKQLATSSKLPKVTTQTRDKTVQSSKVVRKQLFKPQDNEKTIQQQLFKPEIEDDIGNTIELESTADIEVDENTNLILQSQSGGIKSAGVDSANNIDIEGIANNIDLAEIETNNEAEDIKSRENGPRPRRNPKGIRWNGWFVNYNVGGSSGSGRDGVSRWVDSGKLDADHDGIDDRDELGDELEGSIRDDIEDKEEEWAKTNERMLPRNAGDNAWWRTSSLCFEIDQICHSPNDNTWFYYSTTTQQTQDNREEEGTTMPFQPTMELKPSANKYDGGKDICDKRISINVDSKSVVNVDDQMVFDDQTGQYSFNIPNNKNGKENMKCIISKSKTHVVLQSLFNDMIGEFYSRTLLRLYQFMTRGYYPHWNRVDSNTANGMSGIINHGGSANNMENKMPWEEDIQFYVHIPYGNKKMLDGHKLLLSGMLSNPDTPSAQSFGDLFVQGEVDEESDENSTNKEGKKKDSDCQCYEKMVFCGYDTFTHDVNVKSADLEPAVDDDVDVIDANSQDEDASEEEEEAEAIATISERDNDKEVDRISFNYDVKYTLWAAGKLDRSMELDVGSCGRSAGANHIGGEYHCKEWYGLRNFLSSNFVKHYPTLEHDIISRRRDQLLSKGVIDNSYQGNTKEYTVVGLTQRTYRRSWINLPQVIETCDSSSFERVICVEVNVENTSSPFEQLLLHRSLDVMIGVHGAQLTQAVLLPPHAHVLELLPWIPDYIRGKWVQTKHMPTPLGVIFLNTDLNHLGFSLDRGSVPQCEGVPTEALQTCFMRNRKEFIWESRDFNVEVNPIMQYIDQFVVFGRDKERTCEEFKDQLDERFVIYQTWCTKPAKWYPMIVKEELACEYDSGYPFDHTINNTTPRPMLFDSRESCCAAWEQACNTTNEYQSQGTIQQVESSSRLSKHVWHNYDLSTADQVQKPIINMRRKRKMKNRKQKQESQQ